MGSSLIAEAYHHVTLLVALPLKYPDLKTSA
jgi:hypothetical protein